MEGLSYMLGGLTAEAKRAAPADAGARKAAETDSAEVVAAAQPDERTPDRRRRRAKAKQLGRGYEYMDLESKPAPPDPGPPTRGFAGTMPCEIASAPTGLAVLADDAFGGGPRLPMLPGTWEMEP
ncbi:hypothetical protein AWC29_27365 [Mycobacterium triplex]|uniref:PPE-PPW subfamily C-terminal domain-containing protein n=1 Tax=Mycobacterium triplex TaxID=47839 RepID=A0ABX3VXV7_9MYCO|nr:hypothetical protein AWC29_27365 [Mycobacterium triplex]